MYPAGAQSTRRRLQRCQVNYAIEAEDVERSFGTTLALDRLSLAATAGSTLAVLGPNGAGKTTLVRIITTLLRPDGGKASVAGFDVVRQAADVRRRLGLTGQFAALDERLTGRENLGLVGALYHLSKTDTRQLADELLERLDLADAADRPVQTYSGGMRRRVDVAAGLLARPEVVVLDEPTTGLDPRNRLAVWSLIEERVAEGSTVLLTTQYLEDAERLADRIVVMHRGRVVANGSADELKALVGSDRVVVTVGAASELQRASAILEGLYGAKSSSHAPVSVDIDHRQLLVSTDGATGVATRVLRALDAAGIEVIGLEVRMPTLDDAFLELTGGRAESSKAVEG